VTEQVDQRVKLMTFALHMSCSNLGRDTDHHE